MELSPLLALFLVAALGFVFGRVQIRGVGLGVAAVLFAGLALSALVPGVALPAIVPELGLALFIYAIGIASGPGFFALFRLRGLRDAGLATVALSLAALLVFAVARALGWSGPTAAGVYCGSLTNTPALAAVVQSLERTGGTSAAPVVSYSVAYPFGVLGLLAAMILVARFFRDDRNVIRASKLGEGLVHQKLEVLTVRVSERGAGKTPDAVRESEKLEIAFGRHKRGESLSVANEDAVLAPGDLMSVIGTAQELARATTAFGEAADVHLELDRQLLDFRRVFVSRPEIVERPLHTLRLFARFGAVITRIRRGEVELLPDEDSELELGDRVRVVAPRSRMAEVSKYFGDSFSSLAELDVLTFGLGIVLGLLLGELPVPLPGGASFRLGVAGGPLVVGLVLGRIGRTGPLVWTLPYSASVTLRQIGVLLFLAGVGLRSGRAFVETLASGDGLPMLLAGALVTFATAFSVVLVAHRVLKLPIDVALGLVSGVHTQPAALAFATEQSKNDLPRLGYASVFPVATVVKIVLAQLLVLFY